MTGLSPAMADNQLRPGPRSRSANTRSPTIPEHRPFISASEPGTEEHRRHGPRRAASYLSLASRTSLSPEPPTPLTGNSDASFFVHDEDKVWYNPSPEQMAEALLVGLMERGSSVPIPVDQNSYVLSLIEAFGLNLEVIKLIEAEYIKAKEEQERDKEHFKKLADEWLKREKQYKAEVKRLELLLCRTSQQGLEAVTLARRHSVVDRNGAGAKKLTSELKRLSAHQREEKSPDKPWERKAPEFEPSIFSNQLTDDPPEVSSYSREQMGQGSGPKPPLPAILDKDLDFHVSEKIRRDDAAAAMANAPRHGRISGKPSETDFRREEDDDFSPFSFEDESY
ncbi:hypothetical protein DL766_010527 [Monosporascus sp. MC13-8B]|uniref:HAUS augmin-like complex subunit 6 N-terminal domain-containing protein n=1 Tax=Monosporascus cannonballus TaxID=155416 RepID=A0ABY0HHL1_9PEZI|nr:hypothetical protein DL762_001042 [Monosporascus cannonballus]RYP00111.1 hypothetical protein DL763_001040 [Monosporascus cannonballus]RYP02034.1 hypothetical protein DL766_010527 [Monosporascus sp. MC13-8B]